MATYPVFSYDGLFSFCRTVFEKHGFDTQDSEAIADVILTADLFGVESHGTQRLMRYHKELQEGMIVGGARMELVRETPVSALIDGHDGMGQLISKAAMELAIDKAKKSGIGMVAVRGSNHYGIAGYYANMALKEGLIGICMTNSSPLAVPTFGKHAMIGSNPLAFSIPAQPVPFMFDAATCVVTRGKLEVYNKNEKPLPLGWTVDENGEDTSDAARVLRNMVARIGGGITPLGGSTEQMGSHKGYGLGMIVEIMTGILAGSVPSLHSYERPHKADTSHFFMAIDFGLFSDKDEVISNLSAYLQELRQSGDGRRVYTHGEKELESRDAMLQNGVPVNPKTVEEMLKIAKDLGIDASEAGLKAL